MKKKLNKIIISLVLFVFAMIMPFEKTLSNLAFNGKYINNVIFIISYLIVGLEILKKAKRNIFKGKVFDENFLMSIATLGAFCIGEFPEAVAVMLFYQIGELFQNYAVDKSRKSIASLMDIRPDFANVCRNNEIEKVDPEDINVGEIIIVKPGEKIPLDGKIVEGKTSIDTKALTGESMPQDVSKNDNVLSGSINISGLIKIEVTKEFGESTVTKILDLVENASSRKSNSENFISKFAKYYTPIVVIIALCLAVIPPFFQNMNFYVWIYRSLSFLVVSCPCALVISIPLSFFGGIGGASKIGILIKGSNYLEALAKAEIIAFDKTGTLTEGVFEVQEVKSNCISEEDLLKYAAYTEYFSNHPIANSIKKAYEKEINEKDILNTEEISGLGISAKIFDKQVLAGNEKLMINKKIEFTKCNKIGTIIYVAIDGKYVGYILIADKIKNDSKKAIENLKNIGVKQTVMLTGDREEVGKEIARELKIDRFFAELLPDEKAEKLDTLIKQKTKKGKVVFVGDGINDAPVLAMADIGIAMGGMGSDSAIEAADIVIMTDEPSKIVNAIKLSKKTMKIVTENIIFAIFIKIAVLILSALGLSTMWQAVFADVGVSIIAIINSLRMLKINK